MNPSPLLSLMMAFALGLGLSACGPASFKVVDPSLVSRPSAEKPTETILPAPQKSPPKPEVNSGGPGSSGSGAGSGSSGGSGPSTTTPGGVTPPKPRPPILSLPGLIPPPDKKDIVETGRLSPTVYYSPIYDEDAELCSPMAKIPMRNMKGEKIMDVCPRTHFNCGFQGSCVIKKDKVQRVYNVIDRVGGEDRFALVSSRCKFGYGVHDKKNRRSFCLEPYVTVAADLDIYDPGDVIFVPAARNLELPSGKKHDGYFIVVDRGGLIKGKGRFDFFAGNQHWRDFENPLSKIKLHDKNSDHEYHRVVGPEADIFRATLKDLIVN